MLTPLNPLKGAFQYLLEIQDSPVGVGGFEI